MRRKARVVRVGRRDQDRLRVGAHNACGLRPVSLLPPIFFANAFQAGCVRNTIF